MIKNYGAIDFAVISLTAIIYIILLIASPPGFWIIDEGNKFLWAENFIHQGSFKLADPAAEISPGHSSFHPPFSLPAKDNSGQNTVFSPLFIVLIAPLVKIGGWKTAALLPLLATLMLIYLVKPLAQRLNLAYRWYTTLLLGAASPLLFYSISLWEHSLAILCLLAGLILALPDLQGKSRQFIAGILFSLAFYLRPESAIFAFALWLILLRRPKAVMYGGLIGILIQLPFNWLLTGSFLPLQISANFITRWSGLNLIGWLVSRLDAAYALLLQSSYIWYISALPIAALLGFLLLPGVFKLLLPLSLLALAIINWFAPDPFLHLGENNSLLYTAPVFLLALIAKAERETVKRLKKALLIALSLVILTVPVYKGMHFAPRLLLPLIPLSAILFTHYIIRLYQSRQVFRFDALIGLLAFQILITAWSVDLLFTRRAFNHRRQEIILSQSKPALITLQWWLQQEMPELYHRRVSYTVDNQLDLRIMLLDYYEKGLRFFTLLVSDEPHPALLNLISAAPPKQIGAFAVSLGCASMNLTGVQYAIGFDVDGAAKLADELGVYYGQIGRLSASEDYLRKAVSWKSEVGKYHYNLGYCLGNQGRYQEALQEIQIAEELDPENPTIRKVAEELKSEIANIERH